MSEQKYYWILFLVNPDNKKQEKKEYYYGNDSFVNKWSRAKKYNTWDLVEKDMDIFKKKHPQLDLQAEKIYILK